MIIQSYNPKIDLLLISLAYFSDVATCGATKYNRL